MADHIHTFAPGASVTCVADADIIGGRLVAITGPRAVTTATESSAGVFGAAAQDATEGDDVLVLRGGVQALVASASITAGQRVNPAADGQVAAVTDERGIGLALTTVTAADQLIQIALD
ncbi:capsid cement protein [Lysinibacter cavernae]|uniref:Putative RecA/RadA family phage recombinase n=1 Tax=Lysinibacter cavernae TaxID=1640652 RepID=A0A7X5QZ00_9MICO|nr:capsid cement protein [Lysinibacter cavernae]NIH52541.1 putative RecA/RadA family phage recombinase [Lysinibacter cavernae]